MNKFLTLIVLIFGIGFFSFGEDLSVNDTKSLLELVSTEKDYSDALDLIESANNSDELKANSEVIELLTSLSDSENNAAPEWLSGDEEATSTDDTKDSEKSPTDPENRSMWTIFILSFASGLAALLTPCVFPMIPMTVSFFTKQSKTKTKGIKNAILYGLSIIVIYILLGTVVTAIFGAEVLNEMSTNPWFNLVFFAILVIFAVSFMGAFEIRLPNKWVNKADKNADKGGLIGIFFMALVLALVSFSCTGPIVGSLIVEAAATGGIAPVIGMFGFSLALALPFTLFAIFPGWMNSLPQSGGWLNTVKVFLGFLELALAFKFLSNADLAWDAHMLEREVFIAIWIAIFGTLALYLFGKIQLPHDSPLERISVGRAMLGITTLALVVYMIPGMWGAPLKLINAFPPPSHYAESPLGVGGGGAAVSNHGNKDMHLGPQKLMVFHDYDKALEYAQKENKSLFVDFTGVNCVNCRRMEETVWGESGIIDMLTDDVVIVSLYVDKKIPLQKKDQTTTVINGEKSVAKTVGQKWMNMQIDKYQIATQPYYRMMGPNGEDLNNGSADYENHSDPDDFRKWLEDGLDLYKEAEKK